MKSKLLKIFVLCLSLLLPLAAPATECETLVAPATTGIFQDLSKFGPVTEFPDRSTAKQEDAKIAIRMLFDNPVNGMLSYGPRVTYPVTTETLAERLAFAEKLRDEVVEYGIGYGRGDGWSVSSTLQKALSENILKGKPNLYYGFSAKVLPHEIEAIGRLFPILFSDVFVEGNDKEAGLLRIRIRSQIATTLGQGGHLSLAFRIYAFDLQRTASLQEAVDYLVRIDQGNLYNDSWKRPFFEEFAIPYLRAKYSITQHTTFFLNPTQWLSQADQDRILKMLKP